MKLWQAALAVGGAALLGAVAIYTIGNFDIKRGKKKKKPLLRANEGPKAEANEEVFSKVQNIIQCAEELCAKSAFKEAQEYFQSAIDQLLEIGKKETMVTAFLRYELSLTHKELGEYEQAIVLLKKASDCFANIVNGNESTELDVTEDAAIHLIQCLVDLTECLCLHSRMTHPKTSEQLLNEAKMYSEQAIKHATKYSSSSNPKEKLYYIKALKSSIQAHMFTREWPIAESQAIESLKILEDITSPTDPINTTIGMWLTQIFLGEEKFPECCEESLKLVKMAQGTDLENYFIQYSGELHNDCQVYSYSEKLFKTLLGRTGGDIGTFLSNNMLQNCPNERIGALSGIISTYLDSKQIDSAIAPLRELEYLLNANSSFIPPLATTKYFRTKMAQVNSQMDSRFAIVNTLVRQRHSLSLPVGTIVQFCTYNVALSSLSNDDLLAEFTQAVPKHEIIEKNSKKVETKENDHESEINKSTMNEEDDDDNDNDEDNEIIIEEHKNDEEKHFEQPLYQLSETIFTGNTKLLTLQSEPLTSNIPLFAVIIRVLNAERNTVESVHVQFVRNTLN